jgi:hypothetical protein
VKDATTMNQSSTRTLSKSYFALPKYDVSFLVLAAAAAAAVGFFFFVAAVNQLPITGAITAASDAFHFRLEVKYVRVFNEESSSKVFIFILFLQ